MKKLICFLFMLGIESVFPSVVEQVANELSPFSQKVSIDALKVFINENSALKYKEDLEKQIDIVATGEDVASFSSLVYEFRSGWIHSGRNFGCAVFNDCQDDGVAQFMLAAVIILQHSVVQNMALIQCALETLRVSIIDANTRIAAVLGEGSVTALSRMLDFMKQ